MIYQITNEADLETSMDKKEAQEYLQLTQIAEDTGMLYWGAHGLAPDQSELDKLKGITRGLPRTAQCAEAEADAEVNSPIDVEIDSDLWDLHKALQILRENSKLKNPLVGPGALRATLKEKDQFQSFANACHKLSKMLNESCTDGDDPYIKIGQAIAPHLSRPAHESADEAWKNYCVDLRGQLDRLAQSASHQGSSTQAVSRKKRENFLVELIYIRVKRFRKRMPRNNGRQDEREFKAKELAEITYQIWNIYFSDTPMTLTKVRRAIKELNS